MDKPLDEMTIAELRKYIAEKNPHDGYGKREAEQAEAVLNAKLLEQTNAGLESVGNRLEGLGAGLNQLNQSLRDGIRSNETVASASSKYSKALVAATVALVVATVGLCGVGVWQAVLLRTYTTETHNLSVTAGQQLVQSRLDSALVNRPYVEIRPVEFFVSGQRDPADATSVFCSLTLEVKNYSSIPAAEVTLSDFKLGSKSRGYLTPQNYPVSMKNLAIFPNSSFKLQMGFVMSPDYHVKRYDEGVEDYEIYLEVSYTTAKEVEVKPKHWYRCNWTYSHRRFSIQSSETDSIRL